jgi:glycosyltransferase involved in cell wall biosynthesis
MAARLKQPFERFSIVPPSVKSPTEPQNGENRGAVRFGHLSSIRWVKGLDLLVTGLSNSRGLDYHLTVRGKVLEPEFFRRVVGQAEAAGIDMHFGGEATPVEKADFFTQCDFLVLPSRLKESRGIAALEALAAGTPVIAPDRGIFSELAEATGGVALYNRDFELAEVLEQCAKNRNEWHARGIAAASAVSQQYPPRISAAAAIDCFTSLVERRD